MAQIASNSTDTLTYGFGTSLLHLDLEFQFVDRSGRLGFVARHWRWLSRLASLQKAPF